MMPCLEKEKVKEMPFKDRGVTYVAWEKRRTDVQDRSIQ